MTRDAVTPERRREPPFSSSEMLLTPAKAAARIGISRRNLDRLRERGEGPPYYQLSEQVRRYHPADLDEFMRTARREPTAS